MNQADYTALPTVLSSIHNKDLLSNISSPVSIHLLRRSQLRFVCHIIWLKAMTIIKAFCDFIVLLISISSTSAIVMYSPN